MNKNKSGEVEVIVVFLIFLVGLAVLGCALAARNWDLNKVRKEYAEYRANILSIDMVTDNVTNHIVSIDGGKTWAKVDKTINLAISAGVK